VRIVIDCNQARTLLALQPASEDKELQEHLAGCAQCVRYREQHHVLDLALRSELRWEAPAALTMKLLALSAMPLAFQPAPRPRPKGWYVTAIYLLTLAAVTLSLLVAWQFFSLLAAQIGLWAALTELLAAPGRGLALLTQVLPQSRYAISFYLSVRDQMLWLLLVAVLWVVLDKWNPQFSLRRRPATP
jgi:hypothetical protein